MPKPHSILMYSDSGGNKTTELCNLFEWYHKKTGKKGRLISADGGGYAPFVDRGLTTGDPTNKEDKVQVWDISGFSNLGFSIIRKLSQGLWPVRKDESKPGTKDNLAFGAWQQCYWGWDEVGIYMGEGLTTISDMFLRGLSKRTDNIGFKASYQITEMMDDGVPTNIAGLQEGHYGICQRELDAVIVEGFEVLPVEILAFSAHVGVGQEKQTGTTVYGPKGAGHAMTAFIPSRFMDTLHLDYVQLQGDNGGQPTRKKVAWFAEHLHPQTGVKFLAKCRVDDFQAIYQFFPNGFIQLDYKQGVNKYMWAVDKIRMRQQGKISEGEFQELVRKFRESGG